LRGKGGAADGALRCEHHFGLVTKTGDLGMVLSVPGVDYKSLDRSEQEYAVKRLEAALKAFGRAFHVYQSLFKSNLPDIPIGRHSCWASMKCSTSLHRKAPLQQALRPCYR
jgi:hypothetical protein